MTFDRVLQTTQADIRVTLYVGGTATDATGTPNITIKREDGTVLVNAQPTTKVAATTGIYKYTLSPAQTANLDFLEATWFAVLASASQEFVTHVEIVGGVLFSIADARSLDPLNSITTYPDADIFAGRTLAESALEDACGVAFVPRYARFKLDGSGGVDLLLPTARPLQVVSATIDGAAITIADIELYRDGRLYYSPRWTEGRRNVVVKLIHGYAVPPPRVGRGALRLARHYLVDSAISDRALSVVTDEGVQHLMTAGARDAVFDVPEANAVVNEYGLLRGVS